MSQFILVLSLIFYLNSCDSRKLYNRSNVIQTSNSELSLVEDASGISLVQVGLNCRVISYTPLQWPFDASKVDSVLLRCYLTKANDEKFLEEYKDGIEWVATGKDFILSYPSLMSEANSADISLTGKQFAKLSAIQASFKVPGKSDALGVITLSDLHKIILPQEDDLLGHISFYTNNFYSNQFNVKIVLSSPKAETFYVSSDSCGKGGEEIEYKEAYNWQITRVDSDIDRNVARIFIVFKNSKKSSVCYEKSIIIDTIPPTIGMNASLRVHLQKGKNPKLLLRYSGFLENVSGISSYRFALGSELGKSDIIAWQEFASSQDPTFLLTLRDNEKFRPENKYYGSLSAIDGAGNMSLPLLSTTLELAPECIEGYSLVYGSKLYGTKDFCVMEHLFQERGEVILGLSMPEAIDRCLRQEHSHSQNGSYALIANQHWLTILDEVLSHNPKLSLLEKRQTLFSGDYIFDLGSGTWQWSNGTVSKEAVAMELCDSDIFAEELSSYTCNQVDKIIPSYLLRMKSSTLYFARLGDYKGFSDMGYIARGGDGLLGLQSLPTAGRRENIGFRCVYIPED